MEKKYYYEIALSLVEGVGAVIAKNLMSYCGSAEQVFKTPKIKLLKIPMVGEAIAANIGNQKDIFKNVENQLAFVEKNNTKLLYYTEEGYPKRLKEIIDAPILLYCQGSVDFQQTRSIAIVGTRKATDYGKKTTEMIVEQLKSYHPIIVSGLAYGIDIAAHKACLKYEIPTIAVMANGLDCIYPSDHKKIAEQIAATNGALLTENPYGVIANALRFPARNRIIAGLVDAVIVVEARQKGGALITAHLANDYNRDVFAIPGNIHQPSSEGCNHLIRNHQASLITSIKDLEYAMNWDEKQSPKQTKIDFDNLDLNETEKDILYFLQHNGAKEFFIDEMSFELKMNVGKLNTSLLNLELLGVIKNLPGKKIILN